MKRLKNSRERNSYPGWHSFLQLIIIPILLITSCTERPQPYSILEFNGKGTILNYSKDLISVQYESDSLNPTAILASNGDLIMYGENLYFNYAKSSGNKFFINSADMTGYLNGKVNTINIPNNEDLIPWFQKSDSVDFTHLEFIAFNSRIVKSYLPYLARLAKIKPDVGIILPDKIDEMAEIFKMFNPRILIGGAITPDKLGILTRLTDLECLSVTLKDSVKTGPLPAMPELEQLIVSGTNYENLTGDEFLSNNKQIQRLSVISLGTFDFSILKPLTNLKELIINSCDSVVNFDLIKDYKKLEVFVPGWKSFNYKITENELTSLRWITFSSEPSQDLFGSFIESHPNLEVVELVKNDKITDLEPLLKLRKLHALTIVDTLTDFVTLKSLKNLKYLSLPKAILNDHLKKAELNKALPGTRLVANEGVCLGSGWLLLLVPLVLLFRFIARQKGPA
jgi:hypothetical protein